jgi:probable F420-dependent oxidoreductase
LTVRLGLSVYDITGRELVELGRAAEAAGFSTLWLGEHIVLPVDYEAEHPATGTATNASHLARIVDPATRLLDPLVALSAVAAVTERIALATGIYLVGLRHPLAVARMTLTLQDVAGGRFMLGVGSGWLEEEFGALGVAFAERRARFDEALAVLRAAWGGGEISFHGEHVSFEHVMMTPEPVHVPLILGGNTEPALRRVASIADGWFSSGNPTFEEAVRLRDRLTALSEEVGRDRPLPVYMRMGGSDPAELARYAEYGFEHVTVWANQLWPDDGDPASKQARFAEAAAELMSVVTPA